MSLERSRLSSSSHRAHKKIVLGGPSHSGKSVLREGLKKAIIRKQKDTYPFFITAAPDGEGCWFQVSYKKNPSRAQQLKKNYKKSFTPEFVNRISNHVEKCRLPLTIVDIGGIPSEENKKICKNATHIVILSRDSEKFEEWRKFAQELDLNIVAEIVSDYDGSDDTILPLINDNILRGSIHHLERGLDVSGRPMVQALAEHILYL
ncbi:MAG: hypothetical protein A4E35_00850 [Methanoregula sp. PtaU1.Bin051]|nr:MAG: hypothetical protein A4E35_00850 [Methanoregula sp. PtaU1.Bin051]